MSMQPGSIDADGLARTSDGKLYVKVSGDASITGGTSLWSDGAQATPSIAFATEATTGFWLSAAGALRASVSGNQAFRADASGNFVIGGALFLGAGTASLSTVDTTIGRQAAGRPVVMAATATPAGGSAALGLCFGSTSGFGIYIGSGVPSVSAAQGSLYLRSDGSSTSTRAYINNSAGSGTTWTAITTAA